MNRDLKMNSSLNTSAHQDAGESQLQLRIAASAVGALLAALGEQLPRAATLQLPTEFSVGRNAGADAVEHVSQRQLEEESGR